MYTRCYWGMCFQFVACHRGLFYLSRGWRHILSQSTTQGSGQKAKPQGEEERGKEKRVSRVSIWQSVKLRQGTDTKRTACDGTRINEAPLFGANWQSVSLRLTATLLSCGIGCISGTLIKLFSAWVVTCRTHADTVCLNIAESCQGQLRPHGKRGGSEFSEGSDSLGFRLE